MDHWQNQQLRGLVWMMRLEAVEERLLVCQVGFEQHLDFVLLLQLTFPVIKGGGAGKKCDTGSQFFGQHFGGVAFFSWAFIVSLGAKKPWMRLLQILLLAAALVSVRPLQDWAFGTPAGQTQAHLNFIQIKNVDDLNRALAQAKGKPVMLDLYADWCVACKEFEKYTFSDPQVQHALSDTVLLQANVTANSAQDKALLKQLNVLGLPTILFFNEQGEEQLTQRVTGFMDATAFNAHLRNRQP